MIDNSEDDRYAKGSAVSDYLLEGGKKNEDLKLEFDKLHETKKTYYKEAFIWMCEYAGGYFGGLEKYPYLKEFRTDINKEGL